VGGGRWNPAGSFPVVYLNRTVSLARLFVAHKYRNTPYGPEDLDPAEAPLLVVTNVPSREYVDVVTDRGCRAAGLPASYPRTDDGREVEWDACQPVGALAWQEAEAGIACRSATSGAVKADEELAWFQRDHQLQPISSQRFEDWFWGQSVGQQPDAS